jgi:hypothetical protein
MRTAQLRGAYEGARQACQDRGGDLVVIDDAPENAALVAQSSVLDAPPLGLWYIGINDLVSEGTFRWLDNGAVGFTKWRDKEPNDGMDDDDEDCGLFWGNVNDNGNWAAVACSEYAFHLRGLGRHLSAASCREGGHAHRDRGAAEGRRSELAVAEFAQVLP